MPKKKNKDTVRVIMEMNKDMDAKIKEIAEASSTNKTSVYKLLITLGLGIYEQIGIINKQVNE